MTAMSERNQDELGSTQIELESLVMFGWAPSVSNVRMGAWWKQDNRETRRAESLSEDNEERANHKPQRTVGDSATNTRKTKVKAKFPSFPSNFLHEDNAQQDRILMTVTYVIVAEPIPV